MSVGAEAVVALIGAASAGVLGGLGWLVGRGVNRSDQRSAADVKAGVDLALLSNRVARLEVDTGHDLEALSLRHDRDIAELKGRLERAERRAESQGAELAILGDRTQQHEEWHREQRSR